MAAHLWQQAGGVTQPQNFEFRRRRIEALHQVVDCDVGCRARQHTAAALHFLQRLWDAVSA
jgi:hypothetical protein